jgi:hypothetical protein
MDKSTNNTNTLVDMTAVQPATTRSSTISTLNEMFTPNRRNASYDPELYINLAYVLYMPIPDDLNNNEHWKKLLTIYNIKSRKQIFEDYLLDTVREIHTIHIAQVGLEPEQVKKFIEQCKNLEYLYCYDAYDIDFTGLTKLKYLHVHGYIKHIDTMANLINLTTLIFGNFDQDIDVLKNLTNLTKLALYFPFNRKIDALKDLTKLTDLTFDASFNQDVDALKNLTNLTHLTLGNDFNKSIDPLENLTNLTHLTFGRNFNKSIDPLENLTNLTHLTFGRNFNKPIDRLKYLTKLTHLEFGDVNGVFGGNFNQNIDALKYVTNLIYLKFGDDFDQDIDALKYLTSLEVIEFGNNFNQPVDALKNLTKLTQLDFGGRFNQPIDISRLTSLRHLVISNRYYSHKIYMPPQQLANLVHSIPEYIVSDSHNAAASASAMSGGNNKLSCIGYFTF